MLVKLSLAWALLSLCVAIHATGLSAAIHWMRHRAPERPAEFLHGTRLLILVAGWVVILHVIEIAVWAGLYALAGALPNLETALYFSAVTYTTTGYGDVVLPEPWRLVSGIEALTGILMCGLSTGMFFVVFSRLRKAE